MSKKFSIIIKNRLKNFNQILNIAPDKSITHRAFILASQCQGISRIRGLQSEDIAATRNSLKSLGVKILKKKDKYFVFGNGIGSLRKLKHTIDCQNSGSTARMIGGLICTCRFSIRMTGDASLRKRPMGRVIKYINKIGAAVVGAKNKFNLPLVIQGTNYPLAQKHILDVPSAQVKSAIMFSALNTPGTTEIVEKYDTRDHTEILLKNLNAPIKIKKIGKKRLISLKGQCEMQAFDINVPGDPSSACFFIVQTLCMKNSKILLKNICVNHNRIGFIEILNKMGARIKILNQKKVNGEKVGDIFVKSRKLRNISVSKKIIPRTIDELTSLFLISAISTGKATYVNLSELALKESNRIFEIQKGLHLMGIKTKATKDSLAIYGNPNLKIKRNIKIFAHLDHRICMGFFILGQALGIDMTIKGFESVNSSFPNFLKLQKKLGAKYEIKK
tara:strand:+ start:5362 stop:6699 length:1338 start_codon:yes stop_codon:yes gene_type:complete